MSDRGDWDPWDFGEPEGAWADPEVDPYDVPPEDDSWDEERRAAAAGGPPRGALLAALAVMLVLAVGIAAVVVRGDDDDGGDDDETASEVETDDEPSSTSSSSSSSSSSSTSVVDGEGTPDVPAATSTSARGGATTTRAPAGVPTTTAEDDKIPDCAHAGGGAAAEVPADWRDRWQSMPRPNVPARISICIDDKSPRVGQRVEVTLRADDPDAVIVEDECGYLLLWEGPVGNSCRDDVVAHDGPRPTPLQEPGHVIVRFTHVYGTAGARTIVGSVASSRWEGYLTPYANFAEARLPVTVRP